MKVVIRGISKSCKIENAQKEIFDSVFGVLKVVKMTSRKDTMVLPLFLIRLERKENSKKINHLRSLSKILIEIENYRTFFLKFRKAAQCWNYQGFSHISTQCFKDPKYVGYGEAYRSLDCPRKIVETTENVEKIEKPSSLCCTSVHSTRQAIEAVKTSL